MPLRGYHYAALFAFLLWASAPAAAWSLEDAVPTEEQLSKWGNQAEELASDLLDRISQAQDLRSLDRSSQAGSPQKYRRWGWFAKGARRVRKKIRERIRGIKRLSAHRTCTTTMRKPASRTQRPQSDLAWVNEKGGVATHSLESCTNFIDQGTKEFFSLKQLSQMKVKRLQKMLGAAHVEYKGLVEKRDLIDKAWAVCQTCQTLEVVSPDKMHTLESRDEQLMDKLKAVEAELEHYTKQRASEVRLVSKILSKLHSKVQRLEISIDQLKHSNHDKESIKPEAEPKLRSQGERTLDVILQEQAAANKQSMLEELTAATSHRGKKTEPEPEPHTLVQHLLDTQNAIKSLQANVSRHLSEHKSHLTDNTFHGLPLILWDSNLSLWWHVIAELGNLAMWIFVLYFFVWKVLMLFLNQLRSWRHLAIHAQDAVAGAESQSVSRRIPVEAVLGSQASGGDVDFKPDQPRCAICTHKMEEERNCLLDKLAVMGFGNKKLMLQALTDADGDVAIAALSLAKQSSQTLQATPSPPPQSSNVHSDKGLGNEINLDTQWSTEVMRDLIDMGFEDTAANTAALREAEGNLNLAIRNLMVQERCHQPSNQHS